jgi:hypothetical protein
MLTMVFVFFIKYAGELCIFILYRGKKGPYYIARTIHEKIGNTLQHDCLKILLVTKQQGKDSSKSSYPIQSDSMKFISSG